MTLSVCECTLTSAYCRICLIGNKSFYIIIIIITVDERGCTMFTGVLCLFTVVCCA